MTLDRVLVDREIWPYPSSGAAWDPGAAVLDRGATYRSATLVETWIVIEMMDGTAIIVPLGRVRMAFPHVPPAEPRD